MPGPDQPLEPLPWPEGWPRQTLGGCAKPLAFVAMGLLVLLAGLTMLVRGRGADAVMFLGFAATSLVAGVAMAPYFGARPATVTGPHGPGLLLPWSRARRVAHVLLAGSLLVTSAGLAAPGGELARDNPILRVFGVLGVPVFGWYALTGLARLRGTRGVLLDPSGVSVLDGPMVFLAWEHVAAVVATYRLVRSRYGSQRIPMLGLAADDPAHVRRFGGWPKKRAEGIDVSLWISRLGVDPLLAYWTLRHYLEHPEHRAELPDERAVARVTYGSLAGVAT